MNNFITFLNGKKTYLLGLAALAYAIGGYYTGHLTGQATIDAIWAALSVMSVRHGITT